MRRQTTLAAVAALAMVTTVAGAAGAVPGATPSPVGERIAVEDTRDAERRVVPGNGSVVVTDGDHRVAVALDAAGEDHGDHVHTVAVSVEAESDGETTVTVDNESGHAVDYRRLDDDTRDHEVEIEVETEHHNDRSNYESERERENESEHEADRRDGDHDRTADDGAIASREARTTARAALSEFDVDPDRWTLAELDYHEVDGYYEFEYVLDGSEDRGEAEVRVDDGGDVVRLERSVEPGEDRREAEGGDDRDGEFDTETEERPDGEDDPGDEDDREDDR